MNFQSKYGLQVDLSGALGREIPPRVLAERKAGRDPWDVFVHGTTTGLESMIPAGAFDPLEPATIFPDVKDPKNLAWWRIGISRSRQDPDGDDSVPARIIFYTQVRHFKELNSYKDLLIRSGRAN